MATYVGLGITPERRAITVGGTGTPGSPPAARNDLSLDTDGNLRMVHDAEAVGEHARQRLQFYRGEWFLDRSIGIDWFGQVLGFARTRMPVCEAIVKREILRTPGVTGLQALTVRYDGSVRGARVEDVMVATEFDEAVTL